MCNSSGPNALCSLMGVHCVLSSAHHLYSACFHQCQIGRRLIFSKALHALSMALENSKHLTPSYGKTISSLKDEQPLVDRTK